MPSLEISGGRLHYQFEPRPGKPVLVFSNSLGTDLSMWDRQAKAFQDFFGVLRYDARGHGQSSVPAESYSLGEVAQDVLALLDHLDITQASFCGLSLGGMVGQWLAAQASQRFTAFCLCNTAAKIGTPDTWNQRIAAVTSQGMESILAGALERWYTSRFRTECPEAVEATSGMLSRTDPQGYALACAAIRDMDLRASASSIRRPTLVVHGDQDPVTTSEDARFLLHQVAGSEALCLSAAHLSNVEAADAFNAGVLRFLQQVHERSNDG